MDSLGYMMAGYLVIWALTFGCIISIWTRGRKVERELAAVRQLVDELDRNRDFRIKCAKGGPIKQRQGFAHFVFFDLKSICQNEFNAFIDFFRNRQGLLELIGGDLFIAKQIVVSRTV